MKRLSLPLLLTFLVGCTPAGPPTGTVKGKVTLDGYPVAKGVIKFDPGLEHGSPSSLNIEDGEYAGKAFPGLSRVFVSALKSTGQVKLYDTPDSPTRDLFEESIPPRYNKQSGLSYEVKLGTNEYDVAMLTNPPRGKKIELPPIKTVTKDPADPEPKEPAGKEEPKGTPSPVPTPPATSTSPQPPTGPAPAYVPPPPFTPTDRPAVQLLVWTCQLLAVMVLIFVVVGALALLVREKPAVKPASAFAPGEPTPVADAPSSPAAPPSERNAPSLWGKIALLVGGAVCIVALLITAEVVRILVRMEEHNERLEQRMEYLLRR